ncbi:MAG: SHOCT domain-containing protein [Hoeflea sp.]|nr:SHOCT domain-containing protein [Hoeflea sp.]
MTDLTAEARQALAGIASRHGVSLDAAEHVLMALAARQGTQAQFNHPDLGGMGQWSQGGMTMVGDMFNTALKSKVDALCSELAQMLSESDTWQEPSDLSSQSQLQGERVSLSLSSRISRNWWPEDLGQAASTGAQNQMRYAWFPEKARLAIDDGDGAVRIYDTGSHQIRGFGQQQSGGQSLSFTSQHGLVKLSELRQVNASRRDDGTGSPAPSLSEALLKSSGGKPRPETPPASPGPAPAEPDAPEPAGTGTADPAEEADIFAKIERLAALHAKGILTDAEYQAKKAELLARI